MPSQPTLILASSSPYRVELLGRLGLAFEAHAHRCDEAQLKVHQPAPEVLASELARRKALSLVEAHPGALILGSDQVAVDADGAILSKPGTVERAVAQLKRLRGREHRLVTAVALVGPDGQVIDEALNIHTMTLRGDLSDAELRAYVDRDRPLDCAGSYKIESLGIALFQAIRGEDFTAIVGLPMVAVVSMLRRAGLAVFEP
ncbi:MAG: nucleoside triphosphate pyrophosphatase [Myxococcota bacterium]